MRRAALLVALLPALALADAPRELVGKALSAMGGADRLRALRGIKIEGIGHDAHPEQSERPEGPYLMGYEQLVAWRDYAGGRVLAQRQSRGAFFAEWTAGVTYTTPAASFRIADGKAAPGALAAFEDDQEALALSPERLLLAALDAKDLRADKKQVAESLEQDVVRFSWRGRDVRLLLNPYTHLPTVVEVTRAHPENLFLWIWGDVRTRTSYGNWQLVSGVALPMSCWRTVNGLPDADFTITKATLDPGDAPWPTVDDATRSAAEERVRKGPPPFAFAGEGQELAEGVRFYPGRWNATLVRQDAGVVVLEAPLPSEYSEGVIAEAARAFPGAPLVAVISTSDAWPHLSGLRAYAARKLPLYVFELTRPLVQRLLDAPHASHPDAWEKRKQAEPRATADLRPVGKKTVVGAGKNRIELYPIRGEGSERMLMAYLPERKLLYASDLVQPDPGGAGFFNPIYVVELADAVAREKLAVDTVFAMHAGPTPWAKLLEAAAKARAQ